jgi:hypothetical protein
MNTKSILVTRLIKTGMYMCAGFIYGMATCAALHDRPYADAATCGTILLCAAITIRVPTQ